MSQRVSVVVANYNGELLLPDLLDSLEAQSVRPDEVIVVDNASQDFSRELVRSRGASVRLVELERNLGAAEARNVGTAAAAGDVLVFVDNDSVADVDWIREGLAALDRHPGWGAVGSLVGYHANRDVLNGCGADLNRSLFGRDHGFGRPAAACAFREDVCLYAMSNGLFVRRQAAQAVGAWDSAIFYYYEDTDYCLRLWLEGFEVGVAPAAMLSHKLSISPSGAPPQKVYLNERHRIRLALKHLSLPELARWAFHELTGPGGGPRVLPLPSVLRMWAYNLAHLPSVLRFRRRYAGRIPAPAWRPLLAPDWGPRELPLHNFRPAIAACCPRDRIEAAIDGELWRYGAHPPELFGHGTTAQWLDGDAAIDVLLSGPCRRLAARLYAPPSPVALQVHLRLEDRGGRAVWRDELRLTREGWTQPDWDCDLPAGRYRLFVQGNARLVSAGGLRRRLLVAYTRFCFGGD
jgi:GT2 family glycosyltransferase